MISSFTFGGGYVAVPMYRRWFIDKKHLYTEEDLLNISAMAQSSPGAIAVNLAGLSGYYCAGWLGVLISCLASLTPPILILSIISICYQEWINNTLISAALRGMEAGIAALMADLILNLCTLIVQKHSFFLSSLVPIAFIAHFFFHIPVLIILFSSVGIASILVLWKERKL